MLRFHKKPKQNRDFGFTIQEVTCLGKENRPPARIPASQSVEVAVLAVRRCAELQDAPQELDWLSNDEQIVHLRGLVSRILARDDIVRLADESQIIEITEALQTIGGLT